MADIFVSYARLDNKGVFHDKPIKEFVDNLKIKYMQKMGGTELKVFFDEESLKPGDEWTKKIRDELESSKLLLAFLSPTFFSSKYCSQEWDLFANKMKSSIKTKLIIPIRYIKWDKKRFPQQAQKRIGYAEKIQYLDFLDVRTVAPGRYEQLLDKLADLIIDRLSELGHRDDKPNIHVIDKCIDQKIESNKLKPIYEMLKSEPRRYEKTSPVCVLYTGGTVGMIKSDPFDKKSILVTGDVDSLIENLDRLDSFEFDIDFYSYTSPLDSSNINSKDWVKLANIISSFYEYYQGFVILHGTDTMAYTASALSFIFKNLDKPVILTGAERPPTELGSDARTNVMRAIQVAAPKSSPGITNVPEVCILFGKQLMRGNRTKKKKSLDISEGFYSPNYRPLGYIEDDIVLNQMNILRVTGNKPLEDGIYGDELMLDDKISKDKVIIFEIYPDMNLDLFLPVFESPDLKGVILKTYGTGNAPTIPMDFLKYINKMVSRGIIIVNLTQCPEGKVEVRLFETNAKLFDVGVINGGDMTAETAYCKLKYLLGKHGSDKNALKIIKQEMQIDLRGELQYSAYTLSYYHENSDTIIAPIFSGESDIIGDFNPHDIDHAFLRIQGIQPYGDTPTPPKIISLRFYINRAGIGIEEVQNDYKYQIGMIKRKTEFDKKGNPKEITHNLEVTREVVRLVNPKREKYYSLQIVSDKGIHFKFKTLELTIFTQRR